MLARIKAQIKEWQEKGVPIFFLRDPITKLPSVSLTMMVVSFTLCFVSLLNSFAKLFKGIDIENSLQLLIITSSLYLGRSFSKKMVNTEDKNAKE